MSKAYVVMKDYTYHDAGPFGIYSSLEKAVTAVEAKWVLHLTKDHPNGWFQYNGNWHCEVFDSSVTCSTWIQVFEVDAPIGGTQEGQS